MAGESLQVVGEKGNSCLMSIVDRLSHCASKTWALSDVNFSELTSSGKSGLVFLLSDLARELESLEEELHQKIKRS